MLLLWFLGYHAVIRGSFWIAQIGLDFARAPFQALVPQGVSWSDHVEESEKDGVHSLARMLGVSPHQRPAIMPTEARAAGVFGRRPDVTTHKCPPGSRAHFRGFQDKPQAQAPEASADDLAFTDDSLGDDDDFPSFVPRSLAGLAEESLSGETVRDTDNCSCESRATCGTCTQDPGCDCLWCVKEAKCLPNDEDGECAGCGVLVLRPSTELAVCQTDDGDDAEKAATLALVATAVAISVILSILMSLAVTTGFAFAYKQRVVNRKPALMNPVPERWRCHGETFPVGLCDCFGDIDICLHTTCCLPVRMADTYASAGVDDYWKSFWLFIGLVILCRMVLSLVLGHLADQICQGMFAVVFTYKRAALRQRLGGFSHGFPWADCLLLCCCPLCVACQEARVLDSAMGVRTSCCCRLSLAAESELVGIVGPPVATTLQTGGHGNARQLQTLSAMPLQASAPEALSQPLATASAADMQQGLVVGTVVTPSAMAGQQVELQAVARSSDAGDSYQQMND
eukprot:TRINITY_DN42073_c0_g1_i1.p1 TRINITY_DN42073_c0_g1~~TRINITY_DN42073_c0_g1_i1.p1  ORF type:complete len:512 (-),score=56.83 TRINITY_DN42073_c0_g1_i1:118-1653(-)